MQPGTAGTVLLIEDEAALRQPVAQVLREEGFHVYEAPDGPSGLDLIRVHEPEICAIVLDLQLPLLPGPEVLRELQRIRLGVKVILTTTFSRDTVWPALRGERLRAFLRKPYQLSALIDLLRQAYKPDVLPLPFAGGWQSSTLTSYETPSVKKGRLIFVTLSSKEGLRTRRCLHAMVEPPRFARSLGPSPTLPSG